MIAQILRCALALLLIPTLGLAVPGPVRPPNDKLAKAKALTGLSGDVTNATNLDATAETGEFAFGAGNTVWYSFIAPGDGFLEVSYDVQNDAFGFVTLNAYTFPKPTFKSFFSFLTVTGRSHPVLPRTIATIPCTRGLPVRLQFDAPFGDNPGAFTFSYNFLSGSAFTVQGATRPGGIFTWREDQGPISVNIARIGNTEGTATVNYALADDTATAATDLSIGGSALSGTLTFGPGESRKTLTFPIKADSTVEDVESFILELSNPSAGNAIPIANTNFTIEDFDSRPPGDDFASSIDVPTAATRIGGLGRGTSEPADPPSLFNTVWLKTVIATDGLLTITTTSAGSLYVQPFTGTALDNLVPRAPVYDPNIYVDPAGSEAEGTFVVHAGETLYTALSNYSAEVGGLVTDFTLSAVLQASTFRFSEESYRVGEDGDVVLTILRDGYLDNAMTVDFTTSLTDADPEDEFFDTFGTPFAEPDTDYPVTTQTLTFAAGQQEKTVTIHIPRDTKKEPLEHFFVRLENPQGDSRVDLPDHAAVLISDKAPVVEKNYFAKTILSGVVLPTSGPGGEGTISVTLGSLGAFTGSLVLDGKTFKLKSSFPALSDDSETGFSDKTLNFTRTGLPDVVLNLHYVNGQNYLARITGTVSDGASTAAFTARGGSFNFPQSTLGRFTAVLTPDTGVPAAIRAPGYLSIDVTKAGKVKILGGLPDGTKISGSGFLAITSFPDTGGSPEDVFFHLPLYKGTGHLSGQLHLTSPGDVAPAPVAGDGGGSLHWVHPAVTTGPVLTPFVGNFSSFISRFTVPKGALAFNEIAPKSIALTVGAPPAFTGSFTTKGAVTFPANTGGTPSVKLDAKTGLFSGKFTLPGNTKVTTIQGAISRNRSSATGYFLNGNTAGEVAITFP